MTLTRTAKLAQAAELVEANGESFAAVVKNRFNDGRGGNLERFIDSVIAAYSKTEPTPEPCTDYKAAIQAAVDALNSVL